LRSLGFFFFLAALLAFMGGLLQINPVWLYGPYRAEDAMTFAQPDWYTLWLEGGLRMFPGWDITFGGFLLPGIFWPAVVLPGVIIGFLLVWPWLDAFATRDKLYHNVLTPPSVRPARTALAAGGLAAILVLLAAGGGDVLSVWFGADHHVLLRILQGQLFGLPIVVALITYALLRRGDEGDQGAAAAARVED
jgi:ubiquinol-cytochrome c reductase cytochrome b subunit